MAHAGFNMKASIAHSHKLSLHNISWKMAHYLMFSSNSDFILQSFEGRLSLPYCSLLKLERSAFCHVVFSWLILKTDSFGSWKVCLCYNTNQGVRNPTTVQSRHLIHETCSGIRFCASLHRKSHFKSGLYYLLFGALHVFASFVHGQMKGNLMILGVKSHFKIHFLFA